MFDFIDRMVWLIRDFFLGSSANGGLFGKLPRPLCYVLLSGVVLFFLFASAAFFYLAIWFPDRYNIGYRGRRIRLYRFLAGTASALIAVQLIRKMIAKK